MKKTVWIINEYAGSPYHGMGLRHFYIAKKLKERGYNPIIITASFSHLLRRQENFKDSFKLDEIGDVQYLWIRVPEYKGGSDKKRVLKWFTFSYRLFFTFSLVRKHIIEKPDFIIASTPEIFHLVPAYRLAKKFNSKFIYEVRDIWPSSLVELGGFSSRNPFIYLMSRIEKFMYKSADYVVSVLPNFELYLSENGINVKNLAIIPNGICLDDYKDIEPLPKEILRKVPKNKFLIVYTGTFGKANALEYLIRAANLLRHRGEIHFLLVGKGEEEYNLKLLAEGLNNVTFLPSVPKKQVQSILKFADVCYMGLKRMNLFKYGISPNKVFDYMYAGKPILYAIQSEKPIVSVANCGMVVKPESPEAIKEGILRFLEMSEEDRVNMGRRGKKYVLQHHTYEKLVDRWEEVFSDIT